MGRSLVGVALIAALAVGGCATEQAEAPTFLVTAPPQATTTTTQPGRLAWIPRSDLTSAERELCSFIANAERALSTAEQRNRQDVRTTEEAADDRTISEPIRVRMLRDTELTNARRLADVLIGFGAGSALLAEIDPSENLSTDMRASIDADIELVVAIGRDLTAAVDRLKPLDAAERAAYAERTGTDWRDLLTEDDLEQFRAELERSGLGRVEQAHEAMDRIDDWSWRHCSDGFSD